MSKGRIVSVLHEGRAWQAVLLLPTEELLAAPREARDLREAVALDLLGAELMAKRIVRVYGHREDLQTTGFGYKPSCCGCWATSSGSFTCAQHVGEKK